MSLASLKSRALLGMESPLVAVEVHSSNGLPSFTIVGLPEASVKESRERVRSALLSSGFQMPAKRITVNLAPADLPKTGGRYDLAIALGLLVACDQLKVDELGQYECFGELALTGELRGVQGLIPSLLAAKDSKHKLIVPRLNQAEADLVIHTYPQMRDRIYVVDDLLAACRVLMDGGSFIEVNQPLDVVDDNLFDDLADVQGQTQAKRALEVSASGHHSMMMVGPPGAGKSMLASRLISILPKLSPHEAIEVASIRSLVGQDVSLQKFYQRPFIQPHHTASAAAMVGGGTVPKPGALSLAHSGVLFLDELPEFNRAVLEALREPLETKKVNIARVNQHVSYPADSLLITAMNPSPSGFFADDYLGRCKDTPDQILRYQKKISGPLLDRIDLHLQVPAVDIKDLHKVDTMEQESSQVIRQRVVQTRDVQLIRQGCFNSQLDMKALKVHARLDDSGIELLDKAAVELGLSARGYHRILRVARTLADMQSEPQITLHHLAEALSYRSQVNS